MIPAALDIEKLPATIIVPGLSEEEFLAICERFPDSMVEYTGDGTLTIMPPTDPESSERQVWLNYELAAWVRRTGRGGHLTGPQGGFRFPDGSRLAPDASSRYGYQGRIQQ